MAEIILSYQEYPTKQDLPPHLQTLLDQAQEACNKAYAPYSHFYVGAAVALANGEIMQGCNQENSALPAGLCAERTAFYATGVQHPGVLIQSVAITACRDKTNPEPVAVTPCGGCRQVMMEFEERQKSPIQLLMHSFSGSYLLIPSVTSLLPFNFSQQHMTH
ncbi:MAG TPA: cytidine deaminase [Cytophagales bacterium]|nr:cytidine deaminase [Cytophagales bacterium]HAA22793.1 cytidine deaminase [Cytophagales bacterium]HAP65332.1 cytidine deaminase [Cytophagales bacterium]